MNFATDCNRQCERKVGCDNSKRSIQQQTSWYKMQVTTFEKMGFSIMHLRRPTTRAESREKSCYKVRWNNTFDLGDGLPSAWSHNQLGTSWWWISSSMGESSVHLPSEAANLISLWLSVDGAWIVSFVADPEVFWRDPCNFVGKLTIIVIWT